MINVVILPFQTESQKWHDGLNVGIKGIFECFMMVLNYRSAVLKHSALRDLSFIPILKWLHKYFSKNKG